MPKSTTETPVQTAAEVPAETPTPAPSAKHLEAPASVNFRLTAPSGTDYQFTLRDDSEKALLERLRNFIPELDIAGFVSIAKPAAAAAAPAAAPKPPVNMTAPTTAAPAAAPGVETFHCVKMIVTPLSEPDKFGFEFYTDQQGKQRYPVFKATWTAERAGNNLANVGYTPELIAGVGRPTEYPANYWISYKQGKEYAPGKHYKDLVSIVAA